MGADELFGGYRKHLACVLAERYRRLPNGAKYVSARLANALPVATAGRGFRYSRWAKRFLTFSDLPEEAAFRRSYMLYGTAEVADLVDPYLAPTVDGVVDEHEEIYSGSGLSDHVNRMCLTDVRHFLPGLNLAYTDRASMAASTEVRVPFVDPVVFRAAFSLSGSEKVRGRSGKVALKEAASAWLPREIIHRPKGSFSAPLRAWVSKDLQPLINDLLIGGDLVSTGLLRPGPLERMVEEDREGREDRSKQIWQLLTLELWYRQTRAAGVAA
jgi:asparagine synthase (glutamine-hydrolysing)